MIVLDYETRSNVDLIAHGNMRYVMDPSTDILVLGIKVNNQPTIQWQPGDPLPDLSGHRLYPFNASFDVAIWNQIQVKRYGAKPIDIRQVTDVQALCGRYGLPQSLGAVCEVLDTRIKKDKSGNTLIKLFCTPPFGRNSRGEILPELLPLWRDFLAYNRDDCESTYCVVKSLPSDTLSDEEQRNWELNHWTNLNGLPIDTESAKRIFQVTNVFLDEHNGRLPGLTGGAVTKVTQVARIKKWVIGQGIDLPDLKKETVEQMLVRDDLPANVTEVLELRAGMGLSSIGKYRRIIEMEYEGRMYHNSRYYGAHTGRITGMSFQLLNLPRAKVKDPEAELERFRTGDIVFDNPVMSARALIRPMIAPANGALVVADYKSVEYVVLMYLAGETAALERFSAGFDQYVDLATEMYHKAYADILANERQMGKMGILGCGFGLGVKGFIKYADQWGVKITYSEAERTVNSFRQSRPGVVQMWYRLKDTAMMAIEFPGKSFETFNTTFKVTTDRAGREWLAMRIPSGRVMYYGKPEIREGAYGPAVTVMGMDQDTNKYIRRFMTPGKFCENVVQAYARDLLYYGMHVLRDNGFKLIGSIYDEVISEVPGLIPGTPEAEEKLKQLETLMCTLPPYAAGLPLSADGYVSQRYKK